MKNFIFFIALIFALGKAFGQSITISPTDADNTLIQKKDGTAQLSIKGKASTGTQFGASGSSALNLESNYVNAGFGANSFSTINFNTATSNKFSIQHTESTYAPSKLSINANGNEIAKFEPNKMTFASSSSLGFAISPFFPITMSDSYGDKIAIGSYNYDINGSVIDGPHFGLGIQSGLFQVHTKTSSDDIVFGYGKSAAFTETVRMKGNGKVGIGTNTIATNELVQINGRLRLMRNAFASGLWFNNSANGTTLNDGAFLGLSNETSGSETVGFYLNGGFRFLVDRTGNTSQNSATVSNLAGTGVRNVYANASGTLTTAPQTHTLMLTSANFVVSQQDASTYVFGLGSTAGATVFNAGSFGNVFFSTMLNLPNGSVVTSITFYYSDNSASDNLHFTFARNSITDNVSYLSLADLISSSNEGTQKNVSQTGMNVIIDETKIYNIDVRIENGTDSQNVKFIGVKITYTL